MARSPSTTTTEPTPRSSMRSQALASVSDADTVSTPVVIRSATDRLRVVSAIRVTHWDLLHGRIVPGQFRHPSDQQQHAEHAGQTPGDYRNPGGGQRSHRPRLGVAQAPGPR